MSYGRENYGNESGYGQGGGDGGFGGGRNEGREERREEYGGGKICPFAPPAFLAAFPEHKT